MNVAFSRLKLTVDLIRTAVLRPGVALDADQLQYAQVKRESAANKQHENA